MKEDQPVPGIYQHYKGNKYEVVGVARHSEDSSKELVVYKALYESDEFGTNALWVRPRAMFLEEVEIDGVVRPRFQLIEAFEQTETKAD